MTPGPPLPDPQPSPGRTFWSRAIFLSGVTLLVSFGLCGVNFFAVFGVNAALPGPAHIQVRQALGRTLIVFGYLELVGMAVGILGLVISLIGAAVTSLAGRNKT